MRTKALLLTAALSAAGVATSMAQAVYSVNAVGYVNTACPPGFSLISNPLKATDNAISTLFKGVPADTVIYKYNGTTWVGATFDGDVLAFLPADAAAQTVVPGEGVFIKNPTATAFTITFVGEVSQNPAAGTPLSHAIPKGLSVQSSEVPQAGTADSLGLVGKADDALYQFNTTTQAYATYSYDGDVGAWGPPLASLKVGEAFFYKSVLGGTWTRDFNVNAQ
jgi:hypothetical protein